MKIRALIFFVFLSFLSFGQLVSGFSTSVQAVENGEIKPVYQNHGDQTSSLPASFAIEVNGLNESILLQSCRLNTGFGEGAEEEKDDREYTEEERSKSRAKYWVIKAATIERSLTFRDLIYPHHFHF